MKVVTIMRIEEMESRIIQKGFEVCAVILNDHEDSTSCIIVVFTFHSRDKCTMRF